MNHTSHIAATRIAASVDAGVGQLRLVRPDAANAIDLDFARELEEAAAFFATAQPRAVLLSAEGPRFCVGGDLKSFASKSDLPAHLREVTQHLHAGIAALVSLPAPVLAAVRGSAAGAGLGLVCAADIVLTTPATRFVMAYTAVGLSPDGSTSFFLPQLVGLRRALDMALTNRVMTAEEALTCGLISRVVADEALDESAAALAAELAQGPTSAYGRAKRLIREESLDLVAHLHLERESIAQSSATADGREGIQAFVEKRPPSFTGRTEPA